MIERTAILYGDDACSMLPEAVVVVCGVGAVGGFAVEALARLGVENFYLYDFDSFEESNINRQLCALNSTVGKIKVDVQKERILDINPNAKVEANNVFIDEGVADEIASARPTIIIDAIDTIASKVLLAKYAIENNVPIVSSMGAARRRDPLKVTVADIFKTNGCPLASRIRKELRKAGIEKGFKCVYSTEITESSTHIQDAQDNKKIIGSSVVVTGVFGLNLANLALEEIFKIGK